MRRVRAGGIAIVAVVLGLALAGCGSDENKDLATVSKKTSSSSAAPFTTTAPYALSIPDYIKQNGITETPVKRGDPGSPEINLPVPPGWEDLGPQTPAWAWGGMKFTGDPAMAAHPPTIIALLSKLSGNVDPAKILEYAPGEMKNLPGYEGDGVGSASTLGGFDAWQVGGFTGPVMVHVRYTPSRNPLMVRVSRTASVVASRTSNRCVRALSSQSTA